MHECKRILNGEVGGAGLWEVQLGTTPEHAGGDCLHVQGAEPETLENESFAQAADAAADGNDPAEGEAAEDEDEEENVAERKEEGATEHGDEGSATEHGEEEKQTRVQIFRATISLRDNWLHRGDALQDMDLHTYAEYVHHIEKRRAGTRPDQE